MSESQIRQQAVQQTQRSVPAVEALTAHEAAISRLESTIADLQRANAKLTRELEERRKLDAAAREGRSKMAIALCNIRGDQGTFARGDVLPEELVKDGLKEGEHYVRGVLALPR